MDADELALLDEITIKPPEKKTIQFKPKIAQPQEDQQALPNMDAFMNPQKSARQPEPEQDDEYPQEQEDFQEQYAPEPQKPSEGYTSIEDEKGDLLNKLNRLQKKGFCQGRKFGPHTDIEELRTEYKRVMYSIEAEQSIKFQRRILIACVTGIEFLNKRYDPFDIHLDGWSENMMENINDYDGVFEELYAKYRTKVAVAPEIKLIFMVGGSAMMFHLTNSMFKAAIPNVNDVMKQNPELMKNMVEAVKNAQAQNQATTGGPREMRGPGFDIGSLLGGFVPPAMPQNTREPAQNQQTGDDVSDIVSVIESDAGGTKDVRISTKKKQKREKKELTL